MAKQKYADKEHFHPAIIIFIILCIGLIFFQGITHNNKIKALREEINSMPHWECHDETNTEKVILEKWNHLEYPYTTEITCEGEVSVKGYESLDQRIIWVYGEDIGKTCIIKTTKEVCEII